MNDSKKQPKPEELKKIDEATQFEMKDLATILLLIFLYPIGLVFMWFAVKWPKWLKILLTLPIFLAIAATSLAVFMIYKLTASNELPAQLPVDEGVICTQEVKLCPDGNTYVGREGPTCEFTECPVAEPGDEEATSPNSEAMELPNSSTSTPTEETEEIFPTAPLEKE